MILTLTQVAEKLGGSKDFVRRLAREGKLVPVNTKKEGAQRFYAKFDSKAVQELVRSGVIVRPGKGKRLALNAVVPMVDTTETPERPMGTGILSKLDSIERKLDKLVAIWS